ncbi:ThiF family adenylyltransferase [Undibacterium pigrum]|uniref:ThiF family protein n=1 Tax=Undibacterium pigrum TaxID=401470 RepID=A0A318J8Z4_9BURK|nr:ThiF family protein [Undibacterium pigrum]
MNSVCPEAASQVRNFDYEEAFSRNLGWLSELEQEQLRHKRVAIAGMGGVGGAHLLTLARLGIGSFHIADFDHFDTANTNRQAGATQSSMGLPKVSVMQVMAADINPELEIQAFPDGVDLGNMDAFLDGVDIYIDSLDFFAFDIRRQVFAACYRKGIPAVTAAPLGMGTAVLTFLPGRMSFEDYFQMQGQDEFEQGLRFLLGLAPARLHMAYLVDPGRIRLDLKKGPSTVMACQLCAGVAATEALKILLKRGQVRPAPHGVHYDAYRQALKKTWLPGGNRNPLQKLKLSIARKILGASLAASSQTETRDLSAVEKVLEKARWAPSGDNVQNWRFEIQDSRRFHIYAYDTRETVVYDFEGRPSQIALGALLETIYIAASEQKLHAVFKRMDDEHDLPNVRFPVYEVELLADLCHTPDGLATWIERRTVQRRPLSTRPLTKAEKQALNSAVGKDFSLQWQEGWGSRLRMASLLWRNAKIRLTMPEAFQVHKNVIQWNARFSHDRIPDQAIGMDKLGLKLMRWAMHSWARISWMNRYLAGTWLPRLQLDFLPGIACAAHFILVARKAPRTLEDYVAAGRALQRLWLTASSLGIQMQPEMTPLIFNWYVQAAQNPSSNPDIAILLQKLHGDLQAMLGDDILALACFMGRIGHGSPAKARSLRLNISQLCRLDDSSKRGSR